MSQNLYIEAPITILPDENKLENLPLSRNTIKQGSKVHKLRYPFHFYKTRFKRGLSCYALVFFVENILVNHIGNETMLAKLLYKSISEGNEAFFYDLLKQESETLNSKYLSISMASSTIQESLTKLRKMMKGYKNILFALVRPFYESPADGDEIAILSSKVRSWRHPRRKECLSKVKLIYSVDKVFSSFVERIETQQLNLGAHIQTLKGFCVLPQNYDLSFSDLNQMKHLVLLELMLKYKNALGMNDQEKSLISTKITTIYNLLK